MSLPPQTLSKYDNLTLKSPYFLAQIRETSSSIPAFSQAFDSPNPSPFPEACPSPFDLLLWRFAKDFLKKTLLFFSSAGEFRHEFIPEARLFLNCERVYTDNLKPSPSKSAPSDVFSKYWPFFIRILYFLEAFHSVLLMKSKDLTLFELDDQWLLFPLPDLSNFIDDLSLIINNYLKKLTPVLARLNDEKAIFMRVFSFVSFMKVLSHNQNISDASEHYPQDKLERKAKDLLSKLNEKPNIDVKVSCDDDTSSTFLSPLTLDS